MELTSSSNSLVYMDYNATTPLHPEVLNEITHVLKNHWANPSSSYSIGEEAKKVIETARSRIAKMLSAKSEDIIFTSGGTESNHMIIMSVVSSYNEWKKLNGSLSDKPHVITSNIEHDSVILLLRHLKDIGEIDLTVVPVCKKKGQIKIKDIECCIRSTTCLISVMLANNETGIIQPIRSLGSVVRTLNDSRKKHGQFPVLIHSDAAQAIGKIEVDTDDLNIDFLTIVGHKFYGPRIGAVYVKDVRNSYLKPIFLGGGQEHKLRPGTENTGMIAGLGKAAELVTKNLPTYNSQMKRIRCYVEKKLVETFGSNVRLLNCRQGVERLPNTSSIAFVGDNHTGRNVLNMCCHLVASVGAACHSNSDENASSVLVASGVESCYAINAIRLSVGRETTEDDVDSIMKDLKQAIDKIDAGIIKAT